MNARGAMEMAMALVALQYGMISERLFVALVVMALATSAMSGPLMKRLIGLHGERLLLAALREAAFLPALAARTREEVIRELARVAAPAAKVAPAQLARAVLAREEIMSTGVAAGSRFRTRGCPASRRRSRRSASSSRGSISARPTASPRGSPC